MNTIQQSNADGVVLLIVACWALARHRRLTLAGLALVAGVLVALVVAIARRARR